MLTYKFKKVYLSEGNAYRPIIDVEIGGFQFFAVLDTGCDTTVISEGLADAFGIKKNHKTKLMAFRESFEVFYGHINLKFLGRQIRNDELVNNIPCLIVPKEKEWDEDADLVLGVAGIFDKFKITFDLPRRKITMERMQN